MAKTFELRSPHYEEVRATATADKVAGTLELLGATYGFPIVDVTYEDDAEYIAVVKSAKVEVAKAAVAIAAGAALYYDESEENVTTVATDNILVGIANEAAASGDAYVSMAFDGKLSLLTA